MMDIINEMIQSSENIIYLDLDEVLVDFNGGVRKITGGLSKYEYVEKNGYDALWKLINSYGEDWWANLEWTQDGTVLWSFLQNKRVKILTSASVRNTGILAVNGKKRWISNHIGDIEALIVNAARYKQQYARHGDILIDDTEKNIIEWKSKGGIGIHHKNSIESIDELTNIMNIYNKSYEA